MFKISLRILQKVDLTYTSFVKTAAKLFLWKEWLQRQIEIDDSYARKLRKVLKELSIVLRIVHAVSMRMQRSKQKISIMLLDSAIPVCKEVIILL